MNRILHLAVIIIFGCSSFQEIDDGFLISINSKENSFLNSFIIIRNDNKTCIPKNVVDKQVAICRFSEQTADSIHLKIIYRDSCIYNLNLKLGGNGYGELSIYDKDIYGNVDVSHSIIFDKCKEINNIHYTYRTRHDYLK